MPGDNDIQKALEIQLQLRRVFDLHAGGSKDRSGLQRVRELCDLATRATTDQFCRGKLGQVETLADALFSDRKNQKWARSQTRARVSQLLEPAPTPQRTAERPAPQSTRRPAGDLFSNPPPLHRQSAHQPSM